jgi:hypothetical protein
MASRDDIEIDCRGLAPMRLDCVEVVGHSRPDPRLTWR